MISELSDVLGPPGAQRCPGPLEEPRQRQAAVTERRVGPLGSASCGCALFLQQVFTIDAMRLLVDRAIRPFLAKVSFRGPAP